MIYSSLEGISFGSEYDMLMLLGVREDESANRKRSIKKFEIDQTKFARHAVHQRVMVYHPIKWITTEQLWEYLFKIRKLPWGIRTSTLYTLYKDTSGECPITNVTGKQAATCGGSRFGCWTCIYVGDRDKMLENLIESGDETLRPLLDWKMTLYRLRNDIRYRDPLQKRERDSVNKRLVASNQMDIFSMEEERLQLASDWAFQPGALTVEGRKLLFRKLLYVQQMTGYELIEQAEIDAIIESWQSLGFSVTDKDLQPLDWQYEGAMVLNPDATLNHKETTVPFPVFELWEEFAMNQDEIVSFIKKREQKTGISLFYFMQSYLGDELEYNIVQFIVCRPLVGTKLDALQFLEEWLYGDLR